MNKYINILFFRRNVLLNYILSKTCRFWPSSIYLKLLYKAILNRRLNLVSPKTFNEKLQWLKLYDRKPVYTTMVDKIAAKKYVSNIIGEEHVIPTIAEYDDVDKIDWNTLPEQFVIKCAHDSGGMVICKDKANLNIDEAKRKLKKGLAQAYYYKNREWPYKDVPRRLLCERYMNDGRNGGLTDFKFYCFNGEPKYLYVSAGLENHATAKISFLTMDWQFAPFGRSDYAPFTELPSKPAKFDEMLEYARRLSAGFPFLRVDLYEIDNVVYFSELTFFPCSGMMPFVPEEWDQKLGDMLELSIK